MKPQNIEDIYPLSPMQQGIFFHSLYSGHPETYTIQIAWTLRGALDLAAYKRALQDVVDRHAALRTAFAWEKLSEPVQIVWKRLRVSFEEHDLRGLSPDEQAQRVQAFVRAERARGFDLTRAPLMRFGLLRLADDALRFVWGMHHLLLDGWSTQIVIAEVFALYASHARGAAPSLPRARPYGDFVGWLGERDLAQDAAFWRCELAGFASPTPLGVDHPAEGEPRFAEVHVKLGDELAVFARRQKIALNALLQGAWALLLARYSREDDVLFGATVSGRSAPLSGIEGMVGLFINALPVRVRVDPSQPAGAFLAAVQRHEAELAEREHSSLAEVQRHSDVRGGTPLFESLLVFENFPVAEAAGGDAGGALTVAEPATIEHPPYPLTFTASFRRTLTLELGYDARRFDAPAVERMLGHLLTLLEGLRAEPRCPVGHLPLLTASEQERFAAWNDAPVTSSGVLLHELAEQQADARPDAVAVVFDEQQLTYRALDERANQWAHRLTALGVAPDTLVGVCLERSLELPVVLVGVLKAGGAYLPIDPSYPKARVAYMLDDAEAPVLLTGERLREESMNVAAERSARPERAATLEHVAYAIYTSGSTGRPKGAMVPHRAIVEHLWWMQRRFPLGPDRAVLLKTPLSFDLSVWETWFPLMSGARLLVARPGGHREAAYLIQRIADEQLTDMLLVPSMLELFLVEPDVERCQSLQRVFVAGEALSMSLVERLRARLGVDVVNFYGPSECAVGTVAWQCQEGPDGVMEPIGRPLDGVQAHVLDARLERTPVGVAGELYLGGALVGRGYLGRPGLTAERFLADPMSPVPGARLYKTGDLCRYRADGVLEFLGRVDHQVKLRGHRVELGEIEAALRAEPSVREAVVVVRDARLVAYLVPQGEPPSAAELRARLARELPEPMVPAAFVVLDAMPLSPSGKVDRSALPLPGASALASREHVSPRSAVEQAVAGIFAEVLGVPAGAVGATDGFFELGGHSLLATQALARIRAALGVELPLRAVFEAPTAASLGARVEAALERGQRVAAPPLVRAPRSRRMPLSFGQERLWFLAQLEPESPAYTVPAALELRGTLDHAALERALTEIVRRHEVLRTIFTAEDGEPAQVVLPAAPFPPTRLSLAHLPAEERLRAVREEASAAARTPFDLQAAPAIRARSLELAADHHVLLLTMHHIVADQWTGAILSRELTALYAAFCEGRPSPLPELDLQYADYAAWQRRWLSGEALDEQLGYWKAQLEGARHTLELATDRPRPMVQSFRGARRLFELGAARSASLLELSRREGVTLYMTLLAAFDVFLERHSGQDDLLVGTPIAGRSRAETEGLVGFFLNTLVMRARLSPEMTFKALLAQVKETALSAYAHQDLPFERLVREIAPEPDPSRGPLFQVIFNLQSAPRDDLRLPGLGLRGMTIETAATKADLTLIMSEHPDGLTCRLEYATDLFDASTIERFVRRLEALLAAVVRGPDRRLCDLDVLPEDERRLLLSEWNDAAASFETTACYHELFEAAADAAPDAVALVAGGRRVSYGELDRRADRLAHRLRALGVGPDAVVGLRCERTADLVTSALGILKAGGAYLPLDPALPPLRAAQLLEEAGASVVVADAALGARVVVRLDADAEALAAERDERPALDATPANLVYVLFTSGSTGAPKGVAVEHRQLVHYVRGIQPRLGLPARAAYAHVSTFAADIGNTALFVPLATGGVVHLLAHELTLSPDGLGAYFEREGIDCLKIAPSHMSALLAASRPAAVLPRALVVLGGEGLTWELVERIEQLAPGVRILNHYAPTECTIGALTYPVEPGRRVPGTVIAPLGRPLADTQLYVLDASMRPTPMGVPGELYIGGASVSRGYLGKPELTRERFVKDPWSKAPSARLYRTGDRVRYLPDGTVLFLGRTDLQVKVRGFRVELGEIEATLLRYPGAVHAAVLAEDAPGGTRLVAHLSASPEPRAAEVRGWLEQRLPAYMVPAAVVVAEELPLTKSGKVDRRALAEVSAARDEGPESAPQDPVAEVLAGIWADVFGRERVGLHERFSDLGGHSLLAIQIVARARDAFHVEVPLRTLFEAPTVASLAERIAALEDDVAAPSIARAPRDGVLPLSFVEERLLVLDRLEQNAIAYNVSWGVRFEGALDEGALERALAEIVRRHEILRTTYAIGVAPARIIHPEVGLRLAVEDLTATPPSAREQRVRAVVLEDMTTPFDLERGPLLRARLLRLTPDDRVLLVSMHHIVSDARTQGVLSVELGALYDAFRRGAPSPLPELPLQYADYAAWQRGYLAGEVLGEHLDYFLGALRGAPSALDLPSVYARPARQSYRGAKHRARLPASLRKGIRELVHREGATLFMGLLAAFDVLLARWSGQRAIVVGTPAMNRARPETEGLIGCFLNTLALCVEVDHDMDFRGLVRAAREACLGAYAHQDLPFERLVQELAPARDLSRTPIFQVMFTLQSDGPGRSSARATELRGRPLSLPAVSAKFDLTLFMSEGPQGMIATFEYATDLFDEATMVRLGGQLETLLHGVVAAPSAPLHEVPILPEAERIALAVDWNATAADYPRDATVVTLVEAQAARAPDAVAVCTALEALSYGELAERSSRFAGHLGALGVGPGDLVGVMVERTTAMVESLLGVLAAGAAYVPLDPTYPHERLAFQAEDAQLRVLVTETSLEDLAPASPGGVVLLDTESCRQDAGARAILAEPGALAYVIYTSGSTGRPKGVEVTHQALVNFLVSMAREPGLGPSDRLLAVTGLSFDIAGLELWLPLVVGARLSLLDRVEQGDGVAVARRLGEHAITVMQGTPSTFRQLLDAGWTGDGTLDVLVGGEAVPRELVEALARRAGDLWNMYGPTETTIWSCIQRLSAGEPVLIGQPIANTQVYVLDERGALAPIGVPGELAIGGEGLARGYLRRPELTAERFVPDPFSACGGRLYRTGDLARRRAGGALEFLGRLDFQVKLRGFRVELGEIETCLEASPAVAQAIVVAREVGPMDTRLSAYVVPRDPAAPPAPGDLREHLREELPAYMVPASYVVLEALPRTPAGKVDRRALPAPVDAFPRREGSMPRDQTEIQLAAIWRDILQVGPIRVNESFFDVGGQSMLAVRMMAEVERRFGKKLPLATLFEAQTIEALARRLRDDATNAEWPAIVPIRPNGKKRPLFFVARPNVNLLGYITLVRRLDPDQPVYGLQMQYPEEGALGRPYTLEERTTWATGYLELMRAVQPAGPYLVAGMCEGALIAFDMVRLLEEQGEVVKFFGVLDTWPEENTSRRLLLQLYRYERALRVSWRQGLGHLWKSLGLLAKRGLSTHLRVGPLPPKLWDERIFPGPDFVPPKVSCRVDLFRVRRSLYWRIDDLEFGWGNRTDGGVDVHFIDGDHATFMHEEHVPRLAQQMRACLQGVEEEIARDTVRRARQDGEAS